ncbi:MAG: hypothetical protein V1494_08360 [Candidatus Diapherotrites archaeon]
MNFSNLYKGDYRKMMVIPLVLYLVLAFLAFVYPGIPQGIDLKGGNQIIVRADTPITAPQLQGVLTQKFKLKDLQISTISSPTGGFGATIQFAYDEDFKKAEGLLSQAHSLEDSNPEQAQSLAMQSLQAMSVFTQVPSGEGLSLPDLLELADSSIDKAREAFKNSLEDAITNGLGLGANTRFQQREVGPALSESFVGNGLKLALISVVLLVIVIFIYFREFIPSLAIIAAAVFDVLMGLGGMALFGINISLVTIPALLMLVGYSIDTDILLTTRVLKRKEATAADRAYNSMATGLTMTGTTIAAISVMLVLSYFAQMMVVFEIAAVILFGLFGDVISTWFLNAPMLLWYADSKQKKVKK